MARTVTRKEFLDWAKGQLASNKLVIVSDSHKTNTESRYDVYYDIVACSKPSILFMEVPYNEGNSRSALTEYWNNKGHQTSMVKVVNRAFDDKWHVENIDADMSHGNAQLPDGTTGTRIGMERQRFMASRMQIALKHVGGRMGGFLIVGTDHVRGKQMKRLGIDMPAYSKLLTGTAYKDTGAKKVVFGQGDIVLGYSLDP